MRVNPKTVGLRNLGIFNPCIPAAKYARIAQDFVARHHRA
jgi:hypothetical protein